MKACHICPAPATPSTSRIGVLFELLTTLNRFADARHLETGKSDAATLAEFRRGVVVMRELSRVLGLFHDAPTGKRTGNDEFLSGLMQLLIDLRAEARKSKNFAMADQIRQRLAQLKLTLEDRPGGTGWRLG